MGRALVALYQGTGDKRVLDALVKVYADYPAKMGEIDFNDVRGVCNLDAMLETYSYSGDRRILDRAREAIAQPAGDQRPSPRTGQRRPPATRTSSAKISACRPWSIPGPATGLSFLPP